MLQVRRFQSTEAFVRVISSAEQAFNFNTNGASPWHGYSNPDLERLRKGIGPEDINALDAVMPTKERAIELGHMRNPEINELFKYEVFKVLFCFLYYTKIKADSFVSYVLLKNTMFTMFLHDFNYHLVQFHSMSILFTHNNSLLIFCRMLRKSKSLVRQLIRNKNQPNTSALIEITNGSDEPPYHHLSPAMEQPRPVITYMWRDMFRRSVLNGHDILRYILETYNVTVKVTTFEEPIQEVIDLLSHTDLLIGMHGAGWTNAVFLKRGASALQLLPYGWRRPSGFTIRGWTYKNVVLSRECLYTEWANERMDMSFMRRQDFGQYQREARG